MSRQELWINEVIAWLVFKLNPNTLYACSTFTPETGMGLPTTRCVLHNTKCVKHSVKARRCKTAFLALYWFT